MQGFFDPAHVEVFEVIPIALLFLEAVDTEVSLGGRSNSSLSAVVVFLDGHAGAAGRGALVGLDVGFFKGSPTHNSTSNFASCSSRSLFFEPVFVVYPSLI